MYWCVAKIKLRQQIWANEVNETLYKKKKEKKTSNSMTNFCLFLHHTTLFLLCSKTDGVIFCFPKQKSEFFPLRNLCHSWCVWITQQAVLQTQVYCQQKCMNQLTSVTYSCRLKQVGWHHRVTCHTTWMICTCCKSADTWATAVALKRH